jgi:hypothetical protein
MRGYSTTSIILPTLKISDERVSPKRIQQTSHKLTLQSPVLLASFVAAFTERNVDREGISD